MNLKAFQFPNGPQLKNDKYINFNINIKIYQKSNVFFNVAYQQRIRIVFLLNSKQNDCAEWHKRAGGVRR